MPLGDIIADILVSGIGDIILYLLLIGPGGIIRWFFFLITGRRKKFSEIFKDSRRSTNGFVGFLFWASLLIYWLLS